MPLMIRLVFRMWEMMLDAELGPSGRGIASSLSLICSSWLMIKLEGRKLLYLEGRCVEHRGREMSLEGETEVLVQGSFEFVEHKSVWRGLTGMHGTFVFDEGLLSMRGSVTYGWYVSVY